MPTVKLIPSTITEIAIIQFLSGGPERTVLLQFNMPSVPREKYLEMDWRAADKVATLGGLQAANEGDLHGRPGTRGEALCPDTCGRR